MVEDQQPLLGEERRHGAQGVVVVSSAAAPQALLVVVAQVHGVEVVGHVGCPEEHKAVHQPVSTIQWYKASLCESAGKCGKSTLFLVSFNHLKLCFLFLVLSSHPTFSQCRINVNL